MDLPILILAAGQSSRMRGVDKLLEPIDGTALLRRQIDICTKATGQVFVTLPSIDHPRAAHLAQTGATPIIVPDADKGMGISLRTGVAALPPCPAFVVVLADLIELETSDLSAIIDARTTNPDHLIWRGATANGKQGHPILFDDKLRHHFETLTGDTGGATILRDYTDQTHLVPLPGNRALRDLDTPEDWADWRAETGR